MKIILKVLICFILALGCIREANAQYIWKATEAVPAPGRHHSSVFAIGENIYMLCGTNTLHDEQYRDMWKYIPLENRWLQLKDFPGKARSYAATFVINGKGYITVGDEGFLTFTDLWEYTPESDSWEKKADFPGEGRSHPAFFTLNNEGYVGCGDGTSGDYKDFYKYIPSTNTWKRIKDFAGPAHHHPAFFTINDKAYLCTGHDRAGNKVLNTNYEYDPVTDSWTKKANLPAVGRVGSIGFAINNTGIIGGGYDEVSTHKYYRDFYAYNPTTDTWRSTVPPFPELNGTFAAVSAVIGNIAYAGTGMDSLGISTNQWYSFRDESVSVQENTEDETVSAKLFTGRGYVRFEVMNPISSISIINQLGQNMFESERNAGNSMIVSTQGWASGIYLVRYTIGAKVKTLSFIVSG